jgi:hypothetical protein
MRTPVLGHQADHAHGGGAPQPARRRPGPGQALCLRLAQLALQCALWLRLARPGCARGVSPGLLSDQCSWVSTHQCTASRSTTCAIPAQGPHSPGLLLPARCWVLGVR